ncbi:MAG: hypothetical protein ACI37Z_02470 [Candidatus Gastranaerophilaceae bacterium]
MKKKLMIIFSLFLICLTLASCSNAQNENKKDNDSNSSSNIVSTNQNNDDSQSLTENTDTNANVKYDNKVVESIYVEFNGTKIPVESDDPRPLLEIESNSEPIDVKSKLELGSVMLVYDNGETYNFGTVFIGEDDGYYIKITHNDSSKMYKLADDFMK